jgi:integration host factor subunit beta
LILLDVGKKLIEDYGYEEVPIQDIVTLLRDGMNAMADLLEKEGIGADITIPKFGKFSVVRRKARIGHNPKTGEKLNIPEKATMKFKPSSVIKLRMDALSVKGVGKNEAKPKAKKKGKKKK